MPTGPRPSEVSSWFKNGRPFVGKNVPNIDSIKTFEAKWITWWSAAQPLWRDTKNWPFAKGKGAAKDWGHLPDGGKDGLFLIVVSLAWWVYARGPEESKLDDAIADVTWVIETLISYLSTDTTTSSDAATSSDTSTSEDSPLATPSPPERKKRPKPTKTGRATKRARVEGR